MFLDDIVSITSRALFRYPEATTYLSDRGVTEDEIKRFRLGYWKFVGIPDDGSKDRKRFMEESWKGKKYEGMVIFPILDVFGRVVGIVGRSISSKMFKTFVLEEAKFNGFCFGIYQALQSIYDRNKAYVVEGMFDCFAFSKVFPNTVGSLTAGLYENQYEYIHMFCDTVVTVFDSDEPGRAAAQKAKEELKGVETIDLGYKDPDNCLKTMGLAKFRSYVQDKVKKSSFLGLG